MMPAVEQIAAYIDRAERYAIEHEPELARLTREERRRLLTWALYRRRRTDGRTDDR